MSRSQLCTLLCLAALVAAPATAWAQDPPAAEQNPPPAPAPPPAPTGGLKIDGTNASVKVGVLAQPAFEFATGALDNNVDVATFFVRRTRLLFGFTLGSTFELFLETEAANLGRATGRAGMPTAMPPVQETPGGVGNTAIASIQDVFATWKPMDEFKIDVGFMLIPLSHNSVQGATTLYGLDYFAYSFVQNGPIGNYVGRDNGIQLRGLIAKKLEYRLGAFTGRRVLPAAPADEAPSRTALRFAGRLQFNIFDPETAYFYAGTYGGTKRILSIGAGFDIQRSYRAFAGDIFFDWPLGGGVLTAQSNAIYYDGGTWLAAIPKQLDSMAEVGYRIPGIDISPIVRSEIAEYDDENRPDQQRLSFGLAWWVRGHNFNVKAFFTHVSAKADVANATSVSYDQLNLQTQFFLF